MISRLRLSLSIAHDVTNAEFMLISLLHDTQPCIITYTIFLTTEGIRIKIQVSNWIRHVQYDQNNILIKNMNTSQLKDSSRIYSIVYSMHRLFAICEGTITSSLPAGHLKCNFLKIQDDFRVEPVHFSRFGQWSVVCPTPVYASGLGGVESQFFAAGIRSWLIRVASNGHKGQLHTYYFY